MTAETIGPVVRIVCDCGCVLVLPSRRADALVGRLIRAHLAYPEHRAFVANDDARNRKV